MTIAGPRSTTTLTVLPDAIAIDGDGYIYVFTFVNTFVGLAKRLRLSVEIRDPNNALVITNHFYDVTGVTAHPTSISAAGFESGGAIVIWQDSGLLLGSYTVKWFTFDNAGTANGVYSKTISGQLVYTCCIDGSDNVYVATFTGSPKAAVFKITDAKTATPSTTALTTIGTSFATTTDGLCLSTNWSGSDIVCAFVSSLTIRLVKFDSSLATTTSEFDTGIVRINAEYFVQMNRSSGKVFLAARDNAGGGTSTKIKLRIYNTTLTTTENSALLDRTGGSLTRSFKGGGYTSTGNVYFVVGCGSSTGTAWSLGTESGSFAHRLGSPIELDDSIDTDVDNAQAPATVTLNNKMYSVYENTSSTGKLLVFDIEAPIYAASASLLATSNREYTASTDVQSTEELSYQSSADLSLIQEYYSSSNLLMQDVDIFYSASIDVQQTENLSYEASANLFTVVDINYFASADLLSTENISYSSSADLQTTEELEYTASGDLASLIPYFASVDVQQLDIDISYEASSDLQTTNDLEHQTSATILAIVDLSYESSADLQKEEDLIYEASVDILAENDLEYSASANLQATEDLEYSASSNLLSTEDLSCNSSVDLIALDQDISYSASVDVQQTVNQEYQASVFNVAVGNLPYEASVDVLQTIDLSYDSSADLLQTVDISYQASSSLLFTEEIEYSASSDLQKEEEQTYEASVDVQQTESHNYESSTDIQATENLAYETSINIRATEDLSYEVSADLLKTEDLEYQSSADISSVTDLPYEVSVDITQTVNIEYSSSVDLQTTIEESYETSANLQTTEDLDYFTSTNLLATVDKEYASSVDVQSTAELSYEDSANIQQENVDQEYFTSTIVRSTVDESYSASTNLLSSTDESYETSANLAVLDNELSYESSADLRQEVSEEYTVSASVLSTEDLNYQNSANLLSTEEQSYESSADILQTKDVEYNSSIYLSTIIDQQYTASIDVQQEVELEYLLSALIIQLDVPGTYEVSVDVQQTAAVLYDASVDLLGEASIDYPASASIQKLDNEQSYSASLDIQGQIFSTYAVDCDIVALDNDIDYIASSWLKAFNVSIDYAASTDIIDTSTIEYSASSSLEKTNDESYSASGDLKGTASISHSSSARIVSAEEQEYETSSHIVRLGSHEYAASVELFHPGEMLVGLEDVLLNGAFTSSTPTLCDQGTNDIVSHKGKTFIAWTLPGPLGNRLVGRVDSSAFTEIVAPKLISAYVGWRSVKIDRDLYTNGWIAVYQNGPLIKFSLYDEDLNATHSDITLSMAGSLFGNFDTLCVSNTYDGTIVISHDNELFLIDRPLMGVTLRIPVFSGSVNRMVVDPISGEIGIVNTGSSTIKIDRYDENGLFVSTVDTALLATNIAEIGVVNRGETYALALRRSNTICLQEFDLDWSPIEATQTIGTTLGTNHGFYLKDSGDKYYIKSSTSLSGIIFIVGEDIQSVMTNIACGTAMSAPNGATLWDLGISANELAVTIYVSDSIYAGLWRIDRDGRIFVDASLDSDAAMNLPSVYSSSLTGNKLAGSAGADESDYNGEPGRGSVDIFTDSFEEFLGPVGEDTVLLGGPISSEIASAVHSNPLLLQDRLDQLFSSLKVSELEFIPGGGGLAVNLSAPKLRVMNAFGDFILQRHVLPGETVDYALILRLPAHLGGNQLTPSFVYIVGINHLGTEAAAYCYARALEYGLDQSLGMLVIARIPLGITDYVPGLHGTIWTAPLALVDENNYEGGLSEDIGP